MDALLFHTLLARTVFYRVRPPLATLPRVGERDKRGDADSSTLDLLLQKTRELERERHLPIHLELALGVARIELTARHL